jgi:hypothetical protein
MFATQALGLAETFKGAVGKQRLGSAPAYVPELAAPDGDSTAGGKQALQHISLMPEGGGPTLVVGTANTVDKRAELRTYGYVAAMYRKRFKGAPVPFDKAVFDNLLSRFQSLFTSQGFSVTLVDPVVAPAEAAEADVAPGGRSRWLLPAVAAALLIVGLVAFALLKHRG